MKIRYSNFSYQNKRKDWDEGVGGPVLANTLICLNNQNTRSTSMLTREFIIIISWIVFIMISVDVITYNLQIGF